MSEIKFRAKTVEYLLSEKRDSFIWRYGSYAYGCFYPDSYSKHVIIQPQGGMFMIEEKTVCQFTGLLDKWKKEIYEGDIISNKKVQFTIFWNSELCCWDMKRMTGENKYLHEMIWVIQEKYEVIGNIYENPELIPA